MDPPAPVPVPAPPPPKPLKSFLYVASKYSNFIDTFEIDSSNGKLTKSSSIKSLGTIIPLAINPNKKILYAGLDDKKSITSYTIDQTTAALNFQKEIILGISPVNIHVEMLNKNLIIPSYTDSAVAVLPIQADGTPADMISDKKLTGPNSHSAISLENSKFVFVTNTIGNTISQFLFDAVTGILTPNPVEPSINALAVAGPRHFTNNPILTNIIYAVNESGSSVTVYSLDKATGRLSQLQTISTLPQGADATSNACADIHITPDAKFL